MSKKKKQDYGQDNIQILNDIQHMRKRFGMYIGEADNPYQLFSEVIDNS